MKTGRARKVGTLKNPYQGRVNKNTTSIYCILILYQAFHRLFYLIIEMDLVGKYC